MYDNEFDVIYITVQTLVNLGAVMYVHAMPLK